MVCSEQRFWSQVDTSGECWEWTGYTTNGGYGRFNGVLAHRHSYSLTHGTVDPRMMVCHHCDNRKCVRPDHLFLGDALTNTQDMVAKGRHHNQVKTHCVNGHEFTASNTYMAKTYRNGGTNRQCRRCKADRMLKYKRTA